MCLPLCYDGIYLSSSFVYPVTMLFLPVLSLLYLSALTSAHVSLKKLPSDGSDSASWSDAYGSTVSL